ncbi:MAG: GEVED domain-containing protein [Bacteroidota bacterium]
MRPNYFLSIKKDLNKIIYYLLFILIFICFQSNSFGQTTVTIGTGSVLGNHPIYPYYGYTYSQSIYYQSEIAMAGTITAIRFYYTGSAYTDNITVGIGHTSKTTYANTTDWVPAGSMTNVYSGNYSYGASTGWYQITLTTPFNYNNSDNLVIAVDENTAGYHTSSDDFYNTSVSGNRSIYYYSDGTNPNPASPPAGTLTSYIANVQLVITPAANCSGTPNAGTASITSSSGCSGVNFTLSASGLSTGTGISYQWQSSPTGAAPWTNITGATSSSYMTSATSTTYYRIVTTCSFSGLSNNSNVVSYTVSGSSCECGSYPAIYASSTADEEIYNVTVGTLNNSSTCATLAPGSGSILNRYSNYVGFVAAPSVQQGASVNFSLTQTSCGGSYGNGFQIYIDWNQDGDFSDSGEQAYSQPVPATGNHTKAGNFTVPMTATVGTTRMRVVNVESTFPTASNYAETSSYSYGETEDYCITVTASAACSGTPTGGTATATPSSICVGETSNLSLSGYTVATGITFQWQSSPNPITVWTNISGATSPSYLAAPSENTNYRCVVTCTNSGLSANSSVELVTIDCIIIGSGTSSTVSYPYYGSYSDARSQFIITASELTAMGFCGGTSLTSLSFNVKTKYSSAAYKNFTISLGHTSASSFSTATWLAPTFTQVFNGNYTTAVGWNLHTFSTGFAWNGIDNIVVQTCYNNTSSTDYDYTYYTSTASNTVCYAYASSGVGCTLAAQYTSTSRPNMKFNYTVGPPCAGTPAGGTTSAVPASVCAGNSSTISLTGQTLACGITYQWQSSPDPITVWTNIAGATSGSCTVSPIVNTNYRCVVTCTNSGLSANSSVTLITIIGVPVYSTIPYSQGFEGPWLSVCDTRERPDNSWINFPVNGDASWRRQDDGVAAAGWSSSLGVYTPESSEGSYSACFNGYDLCSSEQGRLDLYVNLSPPGTKSLCFDYINDGAVDPDDVMDVLLSTDGGSTFPTTLLHLTNASTWTMQTVNINSNSSTCVVRFLATGDCGSSTENIGIDNLSLSLPSVPNCATYTSPANGTTNIVCGIDAIMYWTSNGPYCFPPTSYDIYFGTTASPPYVTNQTGAFYNPGTLLPSTTYYWKIVPRNAGGTATGCVTWSFSTGASYFVSQTTPPISDGFEICADWVVVNGAQPNKWLRGTATAFTGSYSMYINNTSTNNNYDIASASVVHFYKDITFPAGNNDYTLKFYWKGEGESSCDYLRVYFAPTSITPVAGTLVSSTYELTPYIYLLSPTWEYFTEDLPIACSGNETWRLIFSWRNDGSVGTQPPIAIDDIMITMTPRVGTTCSNPVNVTLPYTMTGETTNCMNNDYTNASISSCGSSYESGNDKVYKVLVGAAGCVNVSFTNCSSSSIGFQVYDGCPDLAGSTCVFYSTTGASGGTLTNDINIPSAGYYYFIVDNWAAPSYVDYDISISAPGGNTVNDPVCGAIDLTLGISASGDNTCTNAFGEPAAPACWTTGNMNTVWYRVVVPASKDIAIKTTGGSLLKTQIDVYKGNACTSLTYVDCNQDAPSCGTSYDHSYLLVEGLNSTYAYIRVDGENNLVGTFSILVVDGNNGSPVWQPIVGQDCGPVITYTNPVCGLTTTIDNPGYFAYGNFCDFTGSGICLASGERSSIWYTININANGNLEFDIIPNDYGNPNPITGQSNPGYSSQGDETDYDWALWKWEPACDGIGDNTFCCTEIAAGTTAATKCNYNSLGVTGLYSAADGTSPPAYPGFGGAYQSRLAVTNGEIYVLAISNFADDYVSGYTLQFSATSPVAYATPGATLSWTSSTSNAWNQPGNWGGCSAPTCNLNATINSGGAQPVISADATVKDLTINAGATLTINPGVTLTMCGNFVNNGNLVMSPTATILFNNGSVAQTISGSLTGVNKIGGLTITKTGSSVTLNNAIDIGGNFTTSNTTSIFNANNQVVKIAGNFNTASNATLTNCPNIEFNGTVIQTYTNSSGTITWTNVIMNNSGGGMTLTGTATSNLVIAGALTLTNGIIYTANPPLLIMNTGSTSSSGSAISFIDGPMRKIGNTAFVFPVGDAFNRWMRIGISAPTAASTFQAQYFYTPYSNTTSMAASPLPVLNNVSLLEYWQLDRIAGGNASVTLYWENAISSGINSCAALQAGDLVVARWNGSAWENRSNTIVGGITGSCVGTSAGTVTSDLLTAFCPLTFASKTSAVNPLPVELSSFSGKNNENENILEWITVTEINNDYFTLERAKDGFTFEEIAKIKGAGNSNSLNNYEFIDKSPFDGVTYYRLKQTDFDGTESYAHNLVALCVNHPIDYVIYPNPANNRIMIHSTSSKEENVIIEITDISGRVIVQQKTYNIKGVNEATSIDINKFCEGIYFMTINDINNNNIIQKKFVKIK